MLRADSDVPAARRLARPAVAGYPSGPFTVLPLSCHAPLDVRTRGIPCALASSPSPPSRPPLGWPAAASAAETAAPDPEPGPVLVSDDDTVTLKYDNDKVTASVGIINNGDKQLTVEAVAVRRASTAHQVPDPVEIPAHHQKSVSIEFTNCPKDSTEAENFKIVDHDTHAVLFPAEDQAACQPGHQLEAPLVLPVVGSHRVQLAVDHVRRLGVVRRRPQAAGPRRQDQERPRPGPWEPLPNLGSSWTFKESWASNATVVAATFTAVFGATDVTKTIFGETDSKEVLAIVAFASAAALGLAGTAPLLLQIWRRWNNKTDVTPIGIIFAGAVTLGATGGASG